MKSGNLSRSGSLDSRAGREDGEVRHANLVIGEEFLGHPFVFAQRQSRGARTGVGDVHHFQQAGDVAIVGGDFVKVFGEIEDNIGGIGFDLVDDHSRLVPDTDGSYFVPEFLERADDVRFGRPVVGLQFLGEVLVRRRRARRIEEDQNFVSLFGSNHDQESLNLPVRR